LSERLERVALDRSNQGGTSNRIMSPTAEREPAAMTIRNSGDATDASGPALLRPG
jgi:hypothetical protein